LKLAGKIKKTVFHREPAKKVAVNKFKRPFCQNPDSDRFLACPTNSKLAIQEAIVIERKIEFLDLKLIDFLANLLD
jgi:hypothetical protein